MARFTELSLSAQTAYAQLFEATRPDFAPIYREISPLPEIPPDRVLPGDRLYARPMRAA